MRGALFLYDRDENDVSDARTRGALAHQADQLLRSVASISANIAEGFGRSSVADRSRFFGIALGSLRESFTWYRTVQSSLPSGIVEKRFEQLTQLRQLLIGAQKWLSKKPPGTRLY